VSTASAVRSASTFPAATDAACARFALHAFPSFAQTHVRHETQYSLAVAPSHGAAIAAPIADATAKATKTAIVIRLIMPAPNPPPADDASKGEHVKTRTAQ
jgi:hypothetical protein